MSTSGYDDLARQADSVQAIYRSIAPDGIIRVKQIKPDINTVQATEKGISGQKVFKIVSINGGKKPDASIDGKRSTYSDGTTLEADIGGIGEIQAIAIKFKGGPYGFTIQTSFEKKGWFTLPDMTSTMKKNEFEEFIFGEKPLLARYVKISARKPFQITQFELIGKDKTIPPVIEPPVKPPSGKGIDKYGIKMIMPSAPSNAVFEDLSYKFSEHNTGTRDTFSKKGVKIMNMECSGYYTATLSDNTEELSNKIYGGNHTGSGSNNTTKQGRCYSIGVQQDGNPSFKKEYPQHPDTPDFSKKVAFASNIKKLRSLKGRSIGLKVIAYIIAKKVYFECWIDDDGLVDGKPSNNWFLWYTMYDDGTNLKGEVYYGKSRPEIWWRCFVLYENRYSD